MAAALYQKHEVVPDVLKAPPTATLHMKYVGGEEVSFGNELAPTKVKAQPELKWDADEKQWYTVIMSDPDAPSRKDRSIGEIKHWLVVNIPGSKVNEGQVLAEFIGSGPPEGSGVHRYVFLAYKQPGKISPDEKYVDKHTIEGRRNFNTQAFAAKYKLGEPVAGNFYLAQFDDYVPTLHAQFTG